MARPYAGDMPTHTIETPATSVSFDDEIIRIRSKGMPSTPETLTATFEAVKRLTSGTPHPVLADARAGISWEIPTWKTFIEGATTSFTAIAVVVDPAGETDPGAFRTIIEKLIMPFRLFTEESAALEFLKEIKRA